jgi:CPA2 family monovalent cation:H+ antiporter-2
MILSLPMLIAVVRKLQALGMLLAEMGVTRAAAGDRTDAIRAVVSNTIFIAGCTALFLFILLLSSTTLPSRNVLIVVAAVLIIATVLLWRAFIRLHAKAQGALYDTLSQPPVPRHHEPAPTLPSLLHEALLKTVTLAPESSATGRLIAELKLRTRSGASIVGIERAGQNVINPGPDEELQPGDRVVLLGSGDQLTVAAELLTSPAVTG